MSLQWEQVVVDSADPAALSHWWAEALGWVFVADGPDEYEIRPEPDRMPGLLFLQVPEAKKGKNRLHLDFRPDDQATEVARLLALGARRPEQSYGAFSWVTLQDPEGNEFCVLGGGTPHT
ncbi:VOC family protein [Streptomyces sp. NPDC090106]|uniref:VOC family protein n=1 Tax=Streptomyces sp. NPDC090106 TaxID=3365946 RepID=UPI003811A15E